MFDFDGLKRELAAMRKASDLQVRLLTGVNAHLERVIRQHFGDKLKTQCWGPVSASVQIAPSTSQLVAIVEPPTGQAGIVDRWAVDASDNNALSTTSAWATTPTATDGLRIAMTRGLDAARTMGTPIFGLTGITSPPGNIGQGTPVWVPFNSAEPVAVLLVNADAVRTINVCVQLWGTWYETSEGNRG